MSSSDAKKLILDLLDAGHDAALVANQDGGVDVDIPLSRIPGQDHQVMTLAEAERRADSAIRAAYRALTGSTIDGDPVGFINS